MSAASARVPSGVVLTGSAGVVALGACASALDVGDVEAPVVCPFRLATGLPCPLCGTTRSLVALGRGDLETSVQLNPLGVLLALGGLVFATTLAAEWRRGWKIAWPSWLAPAAGAAMELIWTFQLLARGAT